jgi:uncharacterized protein YuzE
MKLFGKALFGGGRRNSVGSDGLLCKFAFARRSAQEAIGMTNLKRFEVIYDRDADILYISAPNEPAERGVEEHPGIVWRYDESGAPVGVTIIDFANHWYDRRITLVPEISERLDVTEKQVENILIYAISN